MFNFMPRKLTRALVALGLIFTFSALTFAAPRQSFSLRSLDGRSVSANDFRGRVVVLAFGASWLPLSRAQVQNVQKLADRYTGQVEVLWISTDSTDAKSKNYASDEQLRAFAAKHGLRVTVLRDPDGSTTKTFGVDQLPAIVILDRNGQLAGAPLGGLAPNSDLAETLAPRIKSLL